MITMSGRTLSRAWLAVALFSSSDKDRPALYRATNVEEFEGGLRIASTDSYSLGFAWVPSAEWPDADPPGLDERPLVERTIQDRDWLVRDLMRFVARSTVKSEDEGGSDMFVDVDLNRIDYQTDARVQILSPDLAPRLIRFDVPDRLRVSGYINEVPYPHWQPLVVRAKEKLHAVDYTGATAPSMSAWMLERLSKVTTAAGAVSLRMDWLDNGSALWSLDYCPMEHPPRGLFMSASGPDHIDPQSEPAVSLTIALADLLKRQGVTVSPRGTPVTMLRKFVEDDDRPQCEEFDEFSAEPLLAEATELVVRSQSAHLKPLQRALKIGAARASRIIDLLTKLGIVGAPDDDMNRSVQLSLEDWEASRG